ncbi:MAG: hypothetical protein AAF610_00990 [Pseudomonadota bacterium]
MDELNYLSRPPRRTHGSLLSDLHDMNRQFIDLVVSDEPFADRAGLDRCAQQALQGLSERELERLATCPYSLFDIAFADAGVWQQIDASQLTPLSTPDPGAALALTVLIYARQLCQQHDDVARLFLGMTDTVVRLLATRDLPALTACAFAAEPPLKAKLAGHPHFWSDLLDFVRDGTRERQLAAHTLGVQHSAAKFPR